MTAVVVAGLWIGDTDVIRVGTSAPGVWLPIESVGELVLIDPADGLATARVQVTRPDTEMEVIDTESLVAVVERTTGNLVKVDPALGVTTLRDPLAVGTVGDVVVGEDAWVIGSDAVARVPLDGSDPQLIEVSGSATSAAASNDGVMLVVGDTRFDVDETGASAVGDRSPGLVVTKAGDDAVIISDGAVQFENGGATCYFGSAVADAVWGGSVAGPRAVVGASGDHGTLHISLPDVDRCVVYDIVDEPAQFIEPLVVDTVVYVVDRATGRLHIVDVATNGERSVSLFRPGERVEIIHHAGDVIAHEPRTFHGAVVGPEGVRQLIDKSGGRPLVDSSAAADAFEVGGGDYAELATSPPDDPTVLGIGGNRGQVETGDELTANFSFSAARVAVGARVEFVDTSTGEPTSWEWNFGDDTGGSGADVEKAWSTAGTYEVTLTVANEVGEDSTSVSITVEEVVAPTAIIAIDDDHVEVGESVRLTSVSVGEIIATRWEFGDGATGTGREVFHSFSREGSYTVTLTVTTGSGSSTAAVSVMVTTTPPPPVARIRVLSTIVEAGVPTSLASASLNDPDALRWDFADGSTGVGSLVTHTWDEAGIYVIRLTATNEAGSSSTTETVAVLPYLPPPVASFESPDQTMSGIPVQFVDTSSNGTTWSWDFGDGSFAATASASHTYSVAGTFDVTLTVTNRNGSDTATETIEVLPMPLVARFTPSLESAGTDEPVWFVNASVGAVSYSWDFGDGTTSSDVSPMHTYTHPGAFTVVLTATDSTGESDTAEVKIRVNRGN